MQRGSAKREFGDAVHAEAQSSGGRRARRPRAALGRPQAGNAVRRAPLGLPGACVRSCGSARGRGGRRSSAARSGRPCDSSPRRQRDELRCACGTRVGRWCCHRRPASAAAREMGRDQSRRIEERSAISREDSAASWLSGARPARSRSARGQQVWAQAAQRSTRRCASSRSAKGGISFLTLWWAR